MRLALVLLGIALSGCQGPHDGSSLIRDDKAISLRSIHPGRTEADEVLALGYGRPATMYRIERDGALTPLGTFDLGDPAGGVESAPSGDTNAIWFMTPDATAAVRWDHGRVWIQS